LGVFVFIWFLSFQPGEPVAPPADLIVPSIPASPDLDPKDPEVKEKEEKEKEVSSIPIPAAVFAIGPDSAQSSNRSDGTEYLRLSFFLLPISSIWIFFLFVFYLFIFFYASSGSATPLMSPKVADHARGASVSGQP